jgi:hypothetical protein
MQQVFQIKEAKKRHTVEKIEGGKKGGGGHKNNKQGKFFDTHEVD